MAERLPIMLSMAAGGQCLVAALTLETELVPVLAQGAHLLSCREEVEEEEEEVKASCLFLLFLQSRRFQAPYPSISHPLAGVKLHSHPTHGDSKVGLLFTETPSAILEPFVLAHPEEVSGPALGLTLSVCSLHLFIPAPQNPCLTLMVHLLTPFPLPRESGRVLRAKKKALDLQHQVREHQSWLLLQDHQERSLFGFLSPETSLHPTHCLQLPVWRQRFVASS